MTMTPGERLAHIGRVPTRPRSAGTLLIESECRLWISEPLL
jgi:hypothetical protein